MSCFETVAEMCGRIDLVSISTAFTMASDEAACFQVGNDAEHAALCDTNLCSDVAKPRVRVPCEAEQNVGVVAQESPRRTLRGGWC